jgi:7-keto-8-aminopelargonate synthetase-like enzyme
MLSILDANPSTYKAWAEDYYERSVTLSAVQQIYGHAPLTQELAQELNTNVVIESLLADAAEIDYPATRI